MATEAREVAVGRELDAAVARALGWHMDGRFWRTPKGWPVGGADYSGSVPGFSTRDAAACIIVEHLRRRGWSLTIGADDMPLPYWIKAETPDGLQRFESGGDTMPEAMCRVVLAAQDALKGGAE